MSWLLLLLVVVAGLGFLTAVLRTFDLGGPFRDAILTLAAPRLKNRLHPLPDSVERTYWSGLEYQKDAARLGQLGYELTSETDTSPYVGVDAFPGRAAIIKRAPICARHVLAPRAGRPCVSQAGYLSPAPCL